MLGRMALACLAATAAALDLRPATVVLRARGSHSQRLRPPVAEYWITGVDESSGQPYWYNERTGESQWEPPQATQLHWRVVPTVGVTKYRMPTPCSEYRVGCGEEQVLGRYDMAEQSLYVSREQAIVRVDANGAALLVSVGKPPTLYREAPGTPWQCLWAKQSFGFDESHVLSDGNQIGLDIREPDSVIFTIRCEEGSADTSGGGSGGGAQYSEDGLWMWNGAEWVPAA